MIIKFPFERARKSSSKKEKIHMADFSRAVAELMKEIKAENQIKIGRQNDF